MSGPNGAGKTNLLESLHVATQGFSPRTRVDAQLVRFGSEAAWVSVAGERGGVSVRSRVVVRRGGGKQAQLNGIRLASSERLRAQLATLVFTPDRLNVVKGGPAVRRAYFDRVLARLLPAQAALPAAYAHVLAQRNAALRRVGLGLSSPDVVAPWTARLAGLAGELTAARRRTLELIGPPLAACAAELGLVGVGLRYVAEPPSVGELEACLGRDIERAATSRGPHLDEIAVVAGGRDLRVFGSQGEQRLAVLSLLLAEAGVIADRRGWAPLLLLDDVLSELDVSRRSALARLLPRSAQTLISATEPNHLPLEPDQLVRVEPGAARAA